MFKLSNYALTISLLTHAGGADAACGDSGPIIATFTGECTFDNFDAALSSDCPIEDLFPPNEDGTVSAPAAIAAICEYDAPTQFVEIQGTYQKDRRYLGGGGQLVDGANWAIDSARLQRFEANLANSTLIAFPEYNARLKYNKDNGLGENGYPANLNLDTSCDLNTVMCCFTQDQEGENDFLGFAHYGDATTDVCHHDLYDSPQSNHIKDGWSVFPDAETSTHCVGFTWKDGADELIGNMMYDISLHNTVKKGYREGIPGAPMCGCVEHMPVVEEASCRTATRSGVITYSFDYDAENGVTASNTVDILYADCANDADLAAQYKINNADTDAVDLIDEHLVGADGCDAEVDEYLNDEHFVQKGTYADKYIIPDPTQWSDLVVGEGVYFLPADIDPLVTDAEFRALINAGCTDDGGTTTRSCIIRRVCSSCFSLPHRDIYYKRKTAIPTPAERNFLDLFMENWDMAFNDMSAGDFELYSTYADALAGTNAWKACDYGNGADGYGFPRNCGPLYKIGNEWNSYRRHSGGYANHHGFYVELPS